MPVHVCSTYSRMTTDTQMNFNSIQKLEVMDLESECDTHVDNSVDQNVKVTGPACDTHVDKSVHQKVKVQRPECDTHVSNSVEQTVKVTGLEYDKHVDISIDQKVEDSTGDKQEQELVDFLTEKFQSVAGEDQLIDKKEFVQIFGLQNSFFASRFFELLDQDKEGSIDLHEFVQGMKLLLRGSPQSKLKFLFDVYDVDGSGDIDQTELREVMQQCIEESQMTLETGALHSLTEALFEMADTDHSGSISFQELYAVLEQYPDVMENLTFSAAQWLSVGGKSQTTRRPLKLPRYLTKTYMVNNKQHCVCVVLYTLVNIALLLTCIRYSTHNVAVMIARACGMSLNFNSALILLLMLRHTITWFRSTPLRYVLPLDDHVTYHRNVGYLIVILSVIHSVAHLVNIALVVNESSTSSVTNNRLTLKYTDVLFTMRSAVGFVGPGFAYISGLVLLAVLLVMFIFALPFVRRNGYFQLFHFTHLLYLVFWIFLILHGPIFWMFFLIPGVVFILEKLLPVLHRAGTGAKFFIKEVHLLPSKVTHLVISRPERFTFHPGDYVFIKIPVIARFESHPFTISSAPEQKGSFWLHVQSVGFWTRQLNQYFEMYPHTPAMGLRRRGKRRVSPLKKPSTIPAVQTDSGNTPTTDTNASRGVSAVSGPASCHKVHYRVYIEGPYGTPSRDIFNRDHAVLIASGIGVTPFASILQSVMSRHLNKDQSDLQQDTTDMRLKKVDFIWINRDNSSFGWFTNILQELEDQQRHVEPDERLLHMQMYMTSALSMSDMKGFALQVAIDAMQRKGQRSLVTGLRSQFRPGRPDWNQVFSDIIKKRKGNLKVFFCGNAGLGKVLKEKCEQIHLDFTQELF